MPQRANIRQSTGLSGENSHSLLKIKVQNVFPVHADLSMKIRQRMKESRFAEARRGIRRLLQDRTVTIREGLRATDVQNSPIFARCSMAACG